MSIEAAPRKSHQHARLKLVARLRPRFLTWWSRTLIALYVVGFVAVLWLNLLIGPPTFSLCLVRALVWPVWIATGWPHGVPLTVINWKPPSAEAIDEWINPQRLNASPRSQGTERGWR